MAITVEIRPEVEAELARQAAMRGTPVATYAASLIEDAVHVQADPLTHAGKLKQKGGKSLVEVCAMVRGLADDVDFTRDPSPGRPIDL
jgi:hypothetical protein